MYEKTDQMIRVFLNEGKPVKILNRAKKQHVVVRGAVLNIGLDLQGVDSLITPVGQFYQRSHFPPPKVSGQFKGMADEWVVKVCGSYLTLHDLKSKYPHVERVVHMECTGNSALTNTTKQNVKNLTRQITWRKVMALFDPSHWKPLFVFIRGGRRSDLVSNGYFRGVLLRDVLRDFPPPEGTKELVFFGADRGYDGLYHRISQEEHPYARSFPLEELEGLDLMLCWEMNGRELEVRHGFPLRVVVPGIFGAEYVKWLTEIRPIPDTWKGYFQTEYYAHKGSDGSLEPCHEKGPKSLVLRVRRLRDGALSVIGVAWAGLNPVTHVGVTLVPEVGLSSYCGARWISESLDQSWRWWRLFLPPESVPKGKVTIRPQAWDSSGAWQPDVFPPDKFYGNNSVVECQVKL